MAQVYVKYNPYRLKTNLEINGKDVSNIKDSNLYKVIKGKRLQEWIGELPRLLVEELNTIDFELSFCGLPLDWDDFADSFKEAAAKGIISIRDLKYLEAKDSEDINERIVKVFQDLTNGPVDDFKNPKLLKDFERINDAVFPVNVIATMSSGKSTLINALLGKKLMPSKNEACTATITEILDKDQNHFTAEAYDSENRLIKSTDNLTYEIMQDLNDNDDVSRVYVEGDIPFLDSRTMALQVVDTPGPNNSQNQEHKNTTYRAINNDSNNLIIYVLNGTQLSTNDDASLLHYVAEQMNKGNKQIRDRFLFVINKMDQFNPEEESIDKAIDSARNYLSNYGIEQPMLFPCSAFTALNIRTYLADVDIDNLTRAQQKQLPSAARDTLPMIDKFIDNESMHLEKYSNLTPSAQRELNFRLKKAIENGDSKEQALIHSGIYSIEAAISAYVKKYAKTKKIKDLVESFQEVLESQEVLANAKNLVAENEVAAKACINKAAAVKKKIEDGNEARLFKRQIDLLDPMPSIEKKAKALQNKAASKTTKIFNTYGEYIYSREEAQRLIKQFSQMSSDAMAELATNMESVVNNEIVNTGNSLLLSYQKKIEKIDEDTSTNKLSFNTMDLVKGALKTMQDTSKQWTTDSFVKKTVDDIGEETYENRVYYEKVGEKEEEVAVGTHEEKVGTRKVRVGSHREKTGTKKVENPRYHWYTFWRDKYIEKDVYETIDDYKDEDVYKTVIDYKTIVKDVFEKRTEKIVNFKIKTADIQAVLLSKVRCELDNGIENSIIYSKNQVNDMKAQFSKMFDELDSLIKQKYNELEKYTIDSEKREEELAKNRKILKWIEDNIDEINCILDME